MIRTLDVPDMAKRGDLVQRPAKKSEYEERYLRERTVKRRAALATLARDTRWRHRCRCAHRRGCSHALSSTRASIH